MLYNQRLHVLLGALTGLLFAILLAPHPDTSIEAVTPTEIILNPSILHPQALTITTPVSDKDWCENRIVQAAAKVTAHQTDPDPKYWQYYTGVLRACTDTPVRKTHAPTYRETQNDFNPFSGRSTRSPEY